MPASAIAVTRATARAAGVARRVLIGLSIAVMSAWFGPLVRGARWLRAIFPRNLVARPNMVNAVTITSGCGTPDGANSPQKYGDSGAGFTRGIKGLEMMLDCCKTV